MPATSSSLGLADLALVWDPTRGDADLVMIDSDLASDAGLETAVMLSLFTDRRAADDDVPPSGDPNDRRGWWADAFGDVEGDRYGSRLWLLERAKATRENELRAKEYALEALQWMLDDRVVSAVGVVTELSVDRLSIAVTLDRPLKDPVSFRFDRIWAAMAA